MIIYKTNRDINYTMYMFLTDSAVVLYTKHELSCSSSALNIMMRYRGFIFFIKKKKKIIIIIIGYGSVERWLYIWGYVKTILLQTLLSNNTFNIIIINLVRSLHLHSINDSEHVTVTCCFLICSHSLDTHSLLLNTSYLTTRCCS